MAPTKNRIEVNPPEIILDLSASSAPSATLTLTNPSDENMLFKVRTTNPKRYLVKPNQDTLMAGQSVAVTIQLQGREHADILEKGMAESETQGKDKFMVSCITASDEVLARIRLAKEQGAKELQQAQTDVWASQSKDDTQNRRIAVSFVLPKAGNPTPPFTPSASTAANASSSSAPATNGSVAPASALRPTSSSALSNGAASTTTAAPAASSKAAPQPSAPSMASVVAAHIQTPNKKAEEVVDTITSSSSAAASGSSRSTAAPVLSSGGGGDVELSFDTLSKQYKETLATLVQVTEERDRFQQKFKEVSRELQQAREDTRVTSKRLEGSGEGGQLVVKPGYQIWHLVLVALVSFLVAKLMELAQDESLKSTSGTCNN